MKDPQREVEELRAGVNCATVLEKATPRMASRSQGKLQALPQISPRRRRNRHRHAWRGRVVGPEQRREGRRLRLVQHLEPSLNFGEVRKMLRPLAGVRPDFTPDERARDRRAPLIPIAQDGRAGRACGAAQTLGATSRAGD